MPSSQVARWKLGLARMAGALSRRAGRGGGTSLPGKLLLRFEPAAVGLLAKNLVDKSIVISATNGKTTTARMVADVLRSIDIDPIHNSAGANMPSGVATALLSASRSAERKRTGLFEVDEAWAPQVVRETHPQIVALCNLFRDQLDRYGELDLVAAAWEQMLAEMPSGATVVLNADDPLIAGLKEPGPGVMHFGIDETRVGLPAMAHAADSKHCRRCGAPLTYSLVTLGHLGHYNCPVCDFGRPRPTIRASKIDLHGMDGSDLTIETPIGSFDLRLPVPGLYNVYNALAAAAVCLASGVALDDIASGLAATSAAFGRVEIVDIDHKRLAILLVKNPTGVNEVLRTITLEPGELQIWSALNDGIADGRDVSWVWDADFELLAGRAARVTCAGTRAPELALRLKYAGIDPERLAVEGDIESSLLHALEAVPDGGTLFAIPTYTALLELRRTLARSGDAAEYWEGR